MFFSVSTTMLMRRRPLLQALYSTDAQIALISKMQALEVASHDLEIMPGRTVTLILEAHGVDIDEGSRHYFLEYGPQSAGKEEKKEFFRTLERFKSEPLSVPKTKPTRKRWLGLI